MLRNKLTHLVSLKKSEITQKLEHLQSQWQEEKKLVSEMRELRKKVDICTREMDRLDLLATIQKKSQDLEEVQGEKPLISINVDGQAIAKVVSSWTGVPVGKMIKNEMTTLLSMQEQLSKRVMGQDHALAIITNSLRTARYNLGNPDQPIGIFLLVGPSGTGKTETALALSDILFGGEHNIISLNMSEFKEQHASARLIGPPPGYAGFGKGGLLTEKVRHRPYSVVLLDEIEKSHRDVREFFQQVFDKGYLADTEGQIANFRNTVVIMTANIGDETILDCCFQETNEGLILPKDPMPPLEDLVKTLQQDLLHYFSTSMLARVTIVPYYPLTDEVVSNIIELKLKQIEERLKQNHKIDFEYEREVVNQINMRCTEVQSGARNVNRIITSTILPEITSHIIERLAEGIQTRKIILSSNEKNGFCYNLQ